MIIHLRWDRTGMGKGMIVNPLDDGAQMTFNKVVVYLSRNDLFSNTYEPWLGF